MMMKRRAAATAPLLRMYRRQASCQRLDWSIAAPAAGSAVCTGAATGSDASPRSTAIRRSPRLSRSRVEHSVHDVHEEVGDDDDHRGQHGDPHDDGEVAVEDRVDEVASDPGDREDDLDDEGPGDDEAEERCCRGHGRDE